MIAAVLFALAAGNHALLAAKGQGVVWRHELFVAVNLVAAAGIALRPRWILAPLALLACQQIPSHGADFVRSLSEPTPEVRGEAAADGAKRAAPEVRGEAAADGAKRAAPEVRGEAAADGAKRAAIDWPSLGVVFFFPAVLTLLVVERRRDTRGSPSRGRPGS